jgi:hypothetical protein
MPLQGPFQLDVVAVIGSQEVGADQQQNDVGCIQIFIDGARPFRSRRDPAVMPGMDHPLALQGGEVGAQIFTQLLIPVGVGVEEMKRRGGHVNTFLCGEISLCPG